MDCETLRKWWSPISTCQVLRQVPLAGFLPNPKWVPCLKIPVVVSSFSSGFGWRVGWFSPEELFPKVRKTAEVRSFWGEIFGVKVEVFGAELKTSETDLGCQRVH